MKSISYNVAAKLLARPGYVLTVTFVGTKRGREFSIIAKSGGPSGSITEATAVRLLAHPKCHPVNRGLFPGAPEQTFSFHQNSNRTRNPGRGFGRALF